MAKEKNIPANIIAKANGNQKVVDIRESLKPAGVDHYAAMHNGGGIKTEGGFPSILTICLCDYSRGTGENSLTVSHNIEPWLAYQLYEVAKAASFDYVAPPTVEAALVEQHKSAQVSLLSSRSFYQFFTSTLKTLSTGKGLSEAVRVGMEQARNALAAPTNTINAKMTERKVSYKTSSEKVNAYKRGSDGFAPVSLLSITLTPYRDNGEIARYPWTIKITNGEATVQQKPNGATTFLANTIRNKREAFIMLSNNDVFRMMQRATAFISCWENTFCMADIAEGKERAAQQFNLNQSYAE